MERTNKMETMKMPQLVMNISLPLMVSLLIQSLYNIVDGIFVARLSEDAFTATSLAFPAQLLMIAVGVGTGVGVNALLSRSLGAKDTEMVKKIAATGVVLALISSAVFVLLGIFAAGAFARSFTDNEQIAIFCEQYLKVCMIVCVGSLVATMFQRFLQATGNSFDSMVSLIAGAVTNLIFDPLLIFGIGPFPRMEVIGAAVATVMGQCVSALVAILLNAKRNAAVPVSLKGFRFDGKIAGSIYKVGLPTIVTQAIGSVMMTFMNRILMPISSSAVAFFGAYYKLQNFLFMPMNGLGQAAIPIIGYSYGAKKYPRISEAVRTTLPIAAGIAVVAAVLFIALPSQLLGLFSPTPEMLQIGVPALRIIAVTFIPASVTLILGYSMSGLGNGMVNMLGTAIRQLILLIPLAYLFSRSGVDKIWYAMWISEIAAVLYAALASRNILKRVRHELEQQ